ncbi:MAG: hypothetical protein MRJ92_07915 [Nitrospira sp.]|nr:hypothetical protein [Nitrospira sp.]
MTPTTLQGDAADSQWCATARQTISIDMANWICWICNASAYSSLPFAPERMAQFEEFWQEVWRWLPYRWPAFLDTLVEQGGWSIVSSSMFVTEPPAEFAVRHQKSAVEGLGLLALHYPKVRHLIVRPPKLLTDQTNTTLGRQEPW